MPSPFYRRSTKQYATRRPKIFFVIAAVIVYLIVSPGLIERAFGEARVTITADVPPFHSASETRGEDMYFMRISRDRFFPAETILVSVSSVPRDMIERSAVIGIKPADSPNAALLYREYIHKREETLKLRAPISAGSYVIVGYNNGTVLNDRTEAVKIPFTVEKNSDGAFFVSLDKKNYSPSEQVIAFASGVPREMRDDNALMGIYQSGAPQGNFSEYEYIRRESERIVFRAPTAPGEYEIRAFSNGSVLSDATMTARIPFTVDGLAIGSFNATLPKSYYAPGETVPVDVGGVPQYIINDGAVLGICEAGAPHGAFLTFNYIVSAAGTYLFHAPDKTGEYEIRAYINLNLMTEATLASVARFTVEL